MGGQKFYNRPWIIDTWGWWVIQLHVLSKKKKEKKEKSEFKLQGLYFVLSLCERLYGESRREPISAMFISYTLGGASVIPFFMS